MEQRLLACRSITAELISTSRPFKANHAAPPQSGYVCGA
jgi:hypothetical protein